MIEVYLGPDEIAIARLVGTRRQQSCVRANSKVKVEPVREIEKQHQDAVGSELAVAKHYNKYPTGFSSVGNQNKDADVGRWQVRWTPYLHGALLIRDTDNDEQTFILVVGELPRFWIVGWLKKAGTAKTPDRWSASREKWARFGKPCWIVERDDPLFNLL